MPAPAKAAPAPPDAPASQPATSGTNAAPAAAPDPSPAPDASPEPTSESAPARGAAPEPAAPARGAAPEPAAPAPASSEPTPPEAIVPAPGASASAPAPDPVESPHAPPDGDDLGRLRAMWPEIVSHISKHPPTKPLISVCRPISVEGAVVTLGFPEDQTFLREVAARRGTILEEGIGRYLGHDVAVRCVATNLDLLPALASDAESDFVLAEARRIFEDDLADVGEVS